MEEVFLTKNVQETQDTAEKFAQKLHGGDVVLLHGNLGAGKTTFVQGLAKGLGVTHRIISPTFIILRTYDIQGKSQNTTAKNFYHVDLYRLELEKDIENIGLVDLMGRGETIVAIEWPEKLGTLTPKNAWNITFNQKGENEREIIIKKV